MKLRLIITFASTVLALHSGSGSRTTSNKIIRADDDLDPEDLPDPLPPRLDLEQVFDISEDVEHGGCTQDQIDRLRKAYHEAVDLADFKIPEEIGNFAEGEEDPAVGWMFNYLFGMPGSEQRGPGVPISGNNDLNIGKIDFIMQAITKHAHGIVQYPNNRGIIIKTRLYCSPKWLEFKTTIAAADGSEGPLQSPTWADEGSPPGMLHDVVTNAYLDTTKNPNANDPEFPIDLDPCGMRGYAFTMVSLNVITICPLSWGGSFTREPNTYTFGNALAVTAGEIQVTAGVTHIDELLSLSHTLLHEYMHLVGRGKRNIPFIKSNELEDYGFENCVTLANDPTIGSTTAALGNAENYAYFGTALLRNDYDWRDGVARDHGFWAAHGMSKRTLQLDRLKTLKV
ncbi:hypothetical protein BGZ60DRAFT_563416 [Tricladium varicosporioides]|nr:hypothetical protein BGZ60DRAFT_563416 [Hymenoscyphus varicosporioides]